MDIVIIDDEPKMGQIIQRSLQREGYEVMSTTDAEEALQWIGKQAPRLILCDLKMPKMSGIDVLERARAVAPDVGFIMMTAYASAESAVEAMKKGAYDYIIKPFAGEELKSLIGRFFETQNLKTENASLKSLLGEKFQPDNIVARSGRMQEVLALVRKVARSDASALIRGDSGTGKEVIAGAIHFNGPRRDKPLVKVNCGALPENLLESELFGHVAGAFTGATQTRAGLFEAANGGAIFLDEIGDITPALQVRLLRVLQEGEYMRVGNTRTRKVDVRVIAATHRDLEAAIRDGQFRQDLYYRLNVVSIFIPPLRERPDDIPALIEHFLMRFAPGRRITIDPRAYDTLMQYPWPGNVRELENAVEHAIVLVEGDTVTFDDLPLAIRQYNPAAPELTVQRKMQVGEMSLEDIEKKCLMDALDQAGHNHSQAARILGITRRTLGYRLKKYGLKE